jgi:hypothetical protein
MRNAAKIENVIEASGFRSYLGYNTETFESTLLAIKVVQSCAENDQVAQDILISESKFLKKLEQYCIENKCISVSLNKSNSEKEVISTLKFLELFRTEVNKALSDPNYSAELGPFKGQKNTNKSLKIQPIVQDCDEQNVQAANAELRKIDDALEVYNKQVPENVYTVTPSLQAVMWGTSKQSEVIKKYCPDSASFKKRLKELNAAYEKSLEACQQINSDPAKNCIPALPDYAGYENTLPEIPTQNVNSSTNELASTTQSISDAVDVDNENADNRSNKTKTKNTKKEKNVSKIAKDKKQKARGPVNASGCITLSNNRMKNTCDFNVEVAFCVENPEQTNNFYDSSDAFKCPNGGLSTIPTGETEPNILHGNVQWFACSTVDVATMRTKYDGSAGYQGRCN